ncbi:Ni/Fe hydrogenase subunit alpha [Thiobacter aerophilum]|uniref:Ni/Fe hydrogenase subunit alpha n=1 Tax=Thiobacter aerophilum TaxID=3121275 RepID=A0ABV0EBD2_9BURK
MTQRREIRIDVPVLSRVEGEGALELFIRDGHIERLQLNIYEPPRLFEKLLEGRSFEEVPDAVARICGICPVAYQMSAVRAIESAFGVRVTPWVEAMRRLFYCGEWIESHALHIHLLAAPDFFGCDSVVALAEKAPEAVRRGLRLQALGNDIIRFLGGRSVHPVGARVGGFHHSPTHAEASHLRERLLAALPEAEALVAWCAAWPLPADDQDFECVSLSEPGRYPMMGDRIVSDRGLDIPIADFPHVFEERQVPHSTALHCLLRGRPYLVGPLARLNCHFAQLPEVVRERAQATGITWPSRNMYHSVVARAVEILFALSEAVDLLDRYQETDQPAVAMTPRAAQGFGASEAPRGLLWHHYAFDARGCVSSARIVPPTSQNQARIEADLAANLGAFGLDRDEAALRLRAEQVIRNYDPCISCATHFLRLRLERT